MNISSFNKKISLEAFVDVPVNELKDYICFLCSGVYFQPVIDSCGHVYCKNCLDRSMTITDKCPTSNKLLNKAEIRPFGFIKNVLDNFKMICVNASKGCHWEGKYSEFETHITQECVKQVIKCYFEDCMFTTERDKMHEHSLKCEHREVPCTRCQIPIKVVDEIRHQDSCPEFNLTCPLGCNQKVKRKELSVHQARECPFQAVPCEYSIYGCDSEYMRKDKSLHMEDFYVRHHELMVDYYTELMANSESKVVHLEQVNTILRARLGALKQKKEEEEMMVKENVLKEKVKKNERYHKTDQTQTRRVTRRNPNYSQNILSDNSDEDYEEEKTLGRKRKGIMDKETFENNKLVFDPENKSYELEVVENLAVCNVKSKNKHKIAVADKLLKGNFKWSVQIENLISDIMVGVCKLNKMKNSEFEIDLEETNHGCIVVSSKGIIHNCNQPLKMGNQSDTDVQFENGNTLILFFDEFSKNLTVKGPLFEVVLDNVCSENDTLSPCVILTCEKEKVKISKLGNI